MSLMQCQNKKVLSKYNSIVKDDIIIFLYQWTVTVVNEAEVQNWNWGMEN